MLLKACGDARIRCSDKVGLLTRAIDLISGLRKQLATVKGDGGGGSLPPPGLDIDGNSGGGGAAQLTRRDSKKRGARDRRAHQHHQQEYHHSAAEASNPVLARTGSSKKLAAAASTSGVAEGPVDVVVRCFSATPKAAFAVLGCLGPRTLAAGRAVSRAWRYWHSQARVCVT